ncbi:MAG: bifunctional adenosylcobinamide kinase/adenosylcobinamide-phosphate guanylyltransferase [Bryobacteraceae bacterium]|nr:bifunctional adenosylcobinamide kinase/adenosylcobinamide-phosphate guanylyltransferase [Bryobacteraceae bacterium]
MIILIGGGSRSGKSRHALEYSGRMPEPRVFIATAEMLDDEMRERASAHKSERGDRFNTIEEPINLASAISSVDRNATSVIVDCLTLWVSNLLLAGLDVREESGRMLDAAAEHPAAVLLVTNEVGCGIVPENALARRFRDEAGWLNQRAASAAQEVWWMVFGCPLRVK